MREEGFQGLRTLSIETGEQFTCPLCRQPVTFARKYETGGGDVQELVGHEYTNRARWF